MIAFALGVLVVLVAFWLGASRKVAWERAMDDREQARALASGDSGTA